MLIAVPLGVGVALFVTQYAPRWLSRPAASLVDLLAAVPSIVYGLWGAFVFGPHITGVQSALSAVLGWIPFFATTPATSTAPGTIFVVGIVLSIMILPIVTALSREVFAQTPDHAQGGRAGPRRHPLGDDPHRGPAVRPPRRDQRLDARPRPRARRDHRRRDHPVHAGQRHAVVVVALQRRRDVRLQDRQQRRRSSTARRRPARSSPPAWCCSSSPSSSTRSRASSSSAGRRSPNERPSRPRSTPRRGVARDLPDFQGRSRGRAIRNQIARIVMWAAFLLAMVPLVWILWHAS